MIYFLYPSFNAKVFLLHKILPILMTRSMKIPISQPNFEIFKYFVSQQMFCRDDKVWSPINSRRNLRPVLSLETEPGYMLRFYGVQFPIITLDAMRFSLYCNAMRYSFAEIRFLPTIAENELANGTSDPVTGRSWFNSQSFYQSRSRSYQVK